MSDALKKRLEDEIRILERELNHELPAELKKARAHGDLSENAEYHAAKERQGHVNARLGQLRKRLAEIARKKGVQHFVYTSVGSAHRRTGIPHFDNKWRIEETVRRVGFPSYTILRPVFFMDNFLTASFKPGLLEGKLLIGIKPGTVLQMIAVDDIGKFGLRAFEQHKEMNGRAIDLAGDQQTMPKTAEILSKAVGRKIEFVQVPIAEVRKFSEDFAIMLEWFDRVGYDVDIPKLSAEYGIRPTTLAEWAGQANWA